MNFVKVPYASIFGVADKDSVPIDINSLNSIIIYNIPNIAESICRKIINFVIYGSLPVVYAM